MVGRSLLIWLSACVAVVLGRLAVFTEPYGISVDESNYMTLGQRLMDGGLPYVDAIDRKPPGVFWCFEGLGHLWGPWNIHGVHILFGVFCLFLAWLAYRWTHEILCVLFVPLALHSFPREVISANAEYLMMILLVPSIFLLLKAIQKSSFTLFAFAAFVAGLSTLMKQYAGLIYAPIYLAWVIEDLRHRSPGLLKRQFFAGLASLLGLGICYGGVWFYFWMHQAAEPFLNWALKNGLEFVRDSRSVSNHVTSVRVALSGLFGCWLLFWLAVFFELRWLRSLEKKMILGGLIGALVTAFLSGRYYTHYFVPAAWFLVVLGVPVWSAWAQDFRLWIRRLSWALVLMTFAFWSYMSFDRDRWMKVSFSKDMQTRIEAVATWIKAHSDDTDRIQVWGMAGQIYTMSERGAGSRFPFSDFISGRQPGYKSPESRPVPGTMSIFLDDLVLERPRYFIDTSPASLNDYQFFPLDRFEDLKRFVDEHFTRVAEIEGFTIYEWK